MPTKNQLVRFSGDIACYFMLSILVCLIFFLFHEVFSRMEKGSIRSDNSASIPGELSPTTIRRFILIRLIAPVGISGGLVLSTQEGRETTPDYDPVRSWLWCYHQATTM